MALLPAFCSLNLALHPNWLMALSVLSYIRGTLQPERTRLEGTLGWGLILGGDK
ncbi:hypothetical protein L208DRAFT_1399289, partial [Tricholoma matsutake]